MLSFIVIGRNEGWKLSKCIESIYKVISYNNLVNYEIIYVDSDSSDDSIDRIKVYKGIIIVKILGSINAAVARNVGAAHSKGDILFFIDGDMEIVYNFLPLVYSEQVGLYHDFVSGMFVNYYYNSKERVTFNCHYDKLIEEDKIEYIVGGLFLIKRNIWNINFGMKNKLRTNEDIDFAIRLAKRGIFLLRKKEILAIHNTISYNDLMRSWKLIYDGSYAYRSVLLRDNIFNKYQWKLFFRENYTCFFLATVIIEGIYFYPIIGFVLYFVLLIFRGIKKKSITIPQKINIILILFIKDIITLISIIVFWPSSKKKFKTIIIK